MLGSNSAFSRATQWGSVNYMTEMCSGSETGSYLRLIDFVYHSTLGLRVINTKKIGPLIFIVLINNCSVHGQ